jgi:hypothetical protein
LPIERLVDDTESEKRKAIHILAPFLTYTSERDEDLRKRQCRTQAFGYAIKFRSFVHLYLLSLLLAL